MGTIVYQGLQSCLESQLVEPRTLRLRLSSPKPLFSPSLERALKPRTALELGSTTKELVETKCQETSHSQKSKSSNPDLGGWSFLQALSKLEPIEKETPAYISPLAKRSCSTLSEKSLELCTENLGCETGTDIGEDFSIFSLPQSNGPSAAAKGADCITREKPERRRQLVETKKAITSSRSFPPPLTTMTGSESLRVRPHREDGRLIIEAIKTPSKPVYFHAERSHGRLTLSIFKDCSAPNFDDSTTTVASTQDSEKDVTVCDHDDGEVEEEEEEEEDDDAVEMEEDVGEIDEPVEDLDGEQIKSIGAKVGMEDLQRPNRRRCKEGEVTENEKGLLLNNWEPFWVATS